MLNTPNTSVQRRSRKLQVRSLLLAVSFLASVPLAINSQANRQLERPTASVGHAAAEKRTALVIGNSAYVTSPLSNPSNDATDMAAALKELDFEVISGVDQTRAEMIRLVRQFGERLKLRGGVGLFYYAGHGVQVEGRNYLVPTDAAIRSENEVELEAMDVSRVLVEMENAGNSLNVVVLDACRNNPFSRSWRSTNDGLAQINAPTGTMIAYSTAPGKVASDGAGRNAPYTAALLKAMRTPDLSLSDVFMQVRADVQRGTKRQQTPWEASSIIGRFYFQKGTGSPQAAGTADSQVDQQYWDAVKDSRNAADIQSYLKEFPNGRFAALARLRSSQLASGSSGNSTSPSGVSTRTNPSGITMVYVPPGEFMMGSPLTEDGRSESEGPQLKVTLREGFWIGKYEVTQAQYEMEMGTNPSKFVGCSTCPVERVSWNDAKSFIQKLNAKNDGFIYSLPSDAQWEYAARAGTTTAFAFGDTLSTSQANFDGRLSYRGVVGPESTKTAPVGSYRPNAWGLYDMHGNVTEWTEDIYGGYHIKNVPPDGSANKSRGLTTHRIIRGGSWFSQTKSVRSADRYWFETTERQSTTGFRVAARSK